MAPGDRGLHGPQPGTEQRDIDDATLASLFTAIERAQDASREVQAALHVAKARAGQ
jgi:hypothetical protein